MELLEAKNLSKSFGGLVAIDDVSFSLEGGEVVGIVGPNGAGKSTLLNIISGLLSIDGGKLYYKEKRIDNLPLHERSRIGIVKNFQKARVWDDLTVKDNVTVAAFEAKDGRTLFDAVFRRNKIKREYDDLIPRIKERLKTFGLENKPDELAKNLSGGQQRLLEICMVLAHLPSLLLLDEPLSGLSPQMKEKVMDVFLELKNDGKSIMFVEHDIEMMSRISDKLMLIDHGKIIAYDKPKVITSGELFKIYYGV